MLCPRPTPLNRRPHVPNLPDPHRARPPAQRVRSSAILATSANHSLGSFCRFAEPSTIDRYLRIPEELGNVPNLQILQESERLG